MVQYTGIVRGKPNPDAGQPGWKILDLWEDGSVFSNKKKITWKAEQSLASSKKQSA